MRKVVCSGAERRHISTLASAQSSIGFMPVNPNRRSRAGVLCHRDITALPLDPDLDPVRARAVVANALQQRRALLTEPEAKMILSADGVPVVETMIAKDVEDATRQSERLGYPAALKILSRDISHKTDIGVVVLDHVLVRQAAETMLARVRRLKPDARMTASPRKEWYGGHGR